MDTQQSNEFLERVKIVREFIQAMADKHKVAPEDIEVELINNNLVISKFNETVLEVIK